MDIESGVGQARDVTLADSSSSDTEDTEDIVEKVEQPGLDSLRGTFGAVGTIIRNRRRTALSEAYDRNQVRNRRGSEASGLASQSVNEEPRRPGEERDAEKLDQDRSHFPLRARSSAPILPSAPPRDTNPQGTPSILYLPTSTSPIDRPEVHSSPESEKPDPLMTPPKRAAGLRAHFDLIQQPPSSRIQTSPPPLPSNNTGSMRSRSDKGLTGGRERSSST